MDDEGLSLAVSHNGQYFATGGAAAVVKLWGYEDASLIFEGTGHSGAITGLRQVSEKPMFTLFHTIRSSARFSDDAISQNDVQLSGGAAAIAKLWG